MSENQQVVIPKVAQVISAKILSQLIQTDCGIESAILTTEDGFEVAVESVGEVDSSKLAAMASSLSAISNMSVSESNLGTQYQSLIIESDGGYIVIMDVAYDKFPMILNIVASKDTVLGQLLYHARSVVDAFNKTFG
ncbi:roadblock/LC7 domain-containing protein [Entomomonas asaccharolytica]|uniref:Roadblock/LC7 domain-containing protein n=1 Tax=Entomomonas asaccharolytica TaxID=2785331 RepID=A0A974NDA4_9GAMM|nr:roadblock/LC7 domain-containing protein [Entomomonas asaccharolytica]QQP84656.1 roadblock/LC7 domain-containing protein [Entomomonas asaccharolytica]